MAKVLARFVKQPADKIDYDVSFVEWLAEREQSAVSHTASLDGDAVLDSSALVAGVVKVRVMGGSSGKRNKITVTITTNNGLIKQAEIVVKVKEV